jgi:hypothetical protein
VRAVATLSLLGAAAGTLGGLVFWAVHGETPLTRAIAYGFWFAAAACLVLMLVTGRKLVWRALPMAAYEGWVFTGGAVVLTLAGAVIDTVGTG